MAIGKALFSNIFGENNSIKVLDFLFMGKDYDFTLTHISNGTGLSRTAVRNSIEKQIEEGLIKVTRDDGKSKFYAIDKQSNKYKILNSLYEKIKKEIIKRLK